MKKYTKRRLKEVPVIPGFYLQKVCNKKSQLNAEPSHHSPVFKYEDVLQKTKMLLASRGESIYKVAAREMKLEKEKEAGRVRLNPAQYLDRDKLWELKTELEQSSEAFIAGFYEANPELEAQIKLLSSIKSKQAREEQVGSPGVVYRSVITGRKNTYLYAPAEALDPEEGPSAFISPEEAFQKLKQHHSDYWRELNERENYIISSDRMWELRWYPSVEKSLMEQFNEYRDIFITPERQRRETRSKELHWEITWYEEQFRKRKKYCSTVRWRNKNIFIPNRLFKRYRKTKYRFWFTIIKYLDFPGF